MTFSQETRPIMSSPSHELAVAVEAARRRMPAALVAGSSDIALEAVDAASWRWQSPAGGGSVRLARAGATSTSLEVSADAGTPVAVADALAVELYGALEGTWAPAVPPDAATSMRGRTKVLIGVAAILVPLLAITGYRMLSPPKAMDVASAVTQFRSQSRQAAPSEQEVASDGGGGGQAAPGAEGGTGAGGGGEGTSNGSGKAQAGDLGSAASTQQDQAATSEPAARNSAGQQPAKQTAASRDGGQQQSAQQQQQQQRQRQRGPATPEEGVYRYATSGYESIDQPSSRHDYPSETAMTLRHTDCGFLIHWQPLEDRWDEMTICHEGRDSFIPSMATHREFYGQSKHSKYTCSPGYYAFRPQPGATWTGRCEDDESQMQIRARTLDMQTVRVGDQNVEAVHYIVQATISGANEGTWRVERWVDPDTGLLVRMKGRTQATSDSSVGTVNYREETNLQLLSMTPER